MFQTTRLLFERQKDELKMLGHNIEMCQNKNCLVVSFNEKHLPQATKAPNRLKMAAIRQSILR